MVALIDGFSSQNPEEKYDVIPELWNGHNIADFVDPEIFERLEALEKEEDMREKAGFYNNDSGKICANFSIT